MKPVLVLTVCRRYAELDRALASLADLRAEFAEPPDVVVVWARPEIGRLWYFQALLASGAVTSLLTRPPLPGEADGGATTHPESHNIRLGLEHVRAHYDPAATYAVVQAADVTARPGAYAFVDGLMRRGRGAVVFHWENGCVPVEIWHTNFFACRPDEAYWPPVSPPGESDVLEWQFGKKLMFGRPPGVEKTNNARGKWFAHSHLTEALPPWPVRGQPASAGLALVVAGQKSKWRRLRDWAGRWLRRCIPSRARVSRRA